MNRLSVEKRSEIILALVEGNSLRSVSRMLDVTRNTISRYLLNAGEACQRFHDETVRNLKSRRIEADELWHLILAKSRNLPAHLRGNPEFGDMYTWVSMDPDYKLIVNWHAGKREYRDAQIFIHDLAGRVPRNVQITTDQLTHYRTAVEEAFGSDANYSTIRKAMGPEVRTPDMKWEQPLLKGNRQASVMGNPDMGLATTTHVERNNLQIRQTNRRYARATIAHSKKLEPNRAALALIFTHFNFCRISPVLKVTPGMEAGLTDHVLEIEEMVEMIDRYPARKSSKSGLLEERRGLAVEGA